MTQSKVKESDSVVDGSSLVPSSRQILPKGLSQFEVKVPTEDKDVYAYYYLLKVYLHAAAWFIIVVV